jgi:DMSO/TMAO reductase YedYZ heme-binding membrane subunit
VLASRRHPAFAPAGNARARCARWLLVAALVAGGCGALAAGGAGKDRAVLAAVQRFMLFYSGVFALIALTAAVAAGLVATERIVMSPGARVMSQAVHRALSLAAVGFLATHVVLEVLAHRSRPVDTVGPFLASSQRIYLGFGTLASDLVLLILATGIARRRFARWPALWRAIHVSAYLAWPLAILHGLLAGRHAKPYVYWGYGACLAAVALALAVRLVASTRSRTDVVPHAVPGPGAVPSAHLRRAGIPAARQQAVVWPARPVRSLDAGPAGTRPRGARGYTLPGGAGRAALARGTRPSRSPRGTAWPSGSQPDGAERAADP